MSRLPKKPAGIRLIARDPDGHILVVVQQTGRARNWRVLKQALRSHDLTARRTVLTNARLCGIIALRPSTRSAPDRRQNHE